MKRVRSLIVKEFQQLRRDPRLLRTLLIAPVLQLLVLGFAATTDIREIDLAVRDHDMSRQSREYVRTLSSSHYFVPEYLTGDESRDGEMLVSGRAGLILVIPRGFAGALARGESVAVQVLVDGSDSNFAARGLGYLNRASQLYSESQVSVASRNLSSGASPGLPSVSIEPRAWYNPDLMSRHYMVPGVLGVLLLVTTMVVMSMALVKERESGTMEQLIVTPLRSHELIAGKLLPFVVIGFAEVTLTLPIIILVFQMTVRGGFIMLYAFSGLFLLSTLGLGLLVSTVARTQQQAMMMAAFFFMLPFVLLSGFVFPVANMPAPFRAVAALMPLKYYLTAVRGIFLKGNGLRELWREAVFLAVAGPVILALAAARFRKRLD
ncbi:MAG: ABC transporter permease [Candidatus Eisenbacteria bacterium]|nr:ABC transporter permease [Candidatus Eisenbacteria bacterium]